MYNYLIILSKWNICENNNKLKNFYFKNHSCYFVIDSFSNISKLKIFQNLFLFDV